MSGHREEQGDADETDGERQREFYFPVTDCCVVFMPTGPLPEPVINGGMEEKVSNSPQTQCHGLIWKSALERSHEWD